MLSTRRVLISLRVMRLRTGVLLNLLQAAGDGDFLVVAHHFSV
jgi:hypothetical protein